VKISRELKAGIIVIVSVLGFWWLFQFLKGHNLFSRDDFYYVKYGNVDGLEKSKSVMINGLKVGMIESITPVQTQNKNLSFIVELRINKDYTFSKNSVAQINSEFMGGSFVKLILAEDNAAAAQSGDTLKGVVNTGIVGQLMSDVEPMKNNLNAVLVRLDSTLALTNKVLADQNRKKLEQMLDYLNGTIIEFKTTAQDADGLIKNNSAKISSMLDNTNKMMSATTTTVEKYGIVADKINQADLDKVVKNLQTMLDNINQLTAKMNSGDGTLGKLVNDPAMYNNLNTASKNLSDLLQDLKANPKRYVHFSIFGGGKNKEKPQEEISASSE
jgi:phospholipid/cholesterol/gamma-HCH transport system substrate-binding protein